MKDQAPKRTRVSYLGDRRTSGRAEAQERRLLLKVLAENDGKIPEAAAALGMNRREFMLSLRRQGMIDAL